MSSPLSWSPDLAVGIDFIDQDHIHFLELLEQADGADSAALPALFDAVIQHCVEHFAREEDLMRQTGFFAFHVHAGEHARVLSELRHFRGLLERGNEQPVRDYLGEMVPQWFLNHRATMDQATAVFAKNAGWEG